MCEADIERLARHERRAGRAESARFRHQFMEAKLNCVAENSEAPSWQAR